MRSQLLTALLLRTLLLCTETPFAHNVLVPQLSPPRAFGRLASCQATAAAEVLA